MDRVQAFRCFQAHNRERIDRLIALAPQRQAIFFQLLPLLFHLNSKVLPGYVSTDTPAGIADYRPDKDTLDRAQGFEKNFQFRRRALRSYPLRGLYLIAPAGQLATRTSDYLLWLVHANNVSAEQRPLLQQKLVAVCKWAASLGIAVTPRLLAEADLQQKALTARERESFYSSGLVVAGSVPSWWLLTSAEENDWQHSLMQLQSQRQLSKLSFIDFGPVGSIGADAVFAAGHAAVVKSLQLDPLALLELCYLQQQLQAGPLPPLSQLYKWRLYQGVDNSLALDINMLKLAAIEQTASGEQIAAARQALYLSSREKLSQKVYQPSHPWRRDYISQLVDDWGWSDRQLELLDNIDADFSLQQQQSALFADHCGQFITALRAFARAHDLAAADTLAALQKRYRLRFQPAADAVDTLPLAARSDAGSERLYLHRFPQHDDWILSQIPLQSHAQQGLYRHSSLLHLLAWAVANRILTSSSWFSVNDQQQQLTTGSVMELVQQLLRSSLAVTELSADESRLAAAARPEQVLLFANIGGEPETKLSQQGLQLSTKLSDPLNYSSFRYSLVKRVDGLIRSSYGQWHSVSFSGDSAALEMLAALLRWQPDAALVPHITSWCPTPVFGQAISARLQQLASDVCRLFAHSPQAGRFLLDMADRAWSLEWQQAHVEVQHRPSAWDLWQLLSSNQQQFTAARLDRYLDPEGLFNFLLSHQAGGRISVFIHADHDAVTCYIVDEYGNLLRQPYPSMTESGVVANVHRFLTAIKQHNQLHHVHIYRLQQDRSGWHKAALPLQQHTGACLPVTVTLASNQADSDCTILCGQKWFQGRADDAGLFLRIRELAASLSQGKSPLPICISQLSFEDDRYYPAAVYLQQKGILEGLLNAR